MLSEDGEDSSLYADDHGHQPAAVLMPGQPPASGRPVVWVSRTLPAAYDSAAHLAALGYESLVSPLMQVVFDQSTPDLTGVGALLFTSRNGVAAFSRRFADRQFPVFAVGDATAEAARLAGFQQVASAAGDVAALHRLVRARASRDLGILLRVGAAEPAGALIADLAVDGFSVAEWSAYRTILVDQRRILDDLYALDRPLEAVLIYSPKAAGALSKLLEKRKLSLGQIICISTAASEALRPHTDYPLHIAKRPDEGSLFAALHSNRPAHQPGSGHTKEQSCWWSLANVRL